MDEQEWQQGAGHEGNAKEVDWNSKMGRLSRSQVELTELREILDQVMNAWWSEQFLTETASS